MPETVNKIHGKNNRLSDIEHSYNKQLKDNSSHKLRSFKTVYLLVLRRQIVYEAAIKRGPPDHSFAQMDPQGYSSDFFITHSLDVTFSLKLVLSKRSSLLREPCLKVQ